VLASPSTVWFSHGLSATLTAAIGAGFVIRTFEELDRVPWNALPQLVKADEHYWTVPKEMPSIPLAFALEAEKA
jgi:hypothetical protein